MRHVSACLCVEERSDGLVKAMGPQAPSPHPPTLGPAWLFKSLLLAQSISPGAGSAAVRRKSEKANKSDAGFLLEVFFVWKAAFCACVSGSCPVRWLHQCKVFCWHAARLFLAARLLFIDWVGLQELGEMQK